MEHLPCVSDLWEAQATVQGHTADGQYNLVCQAPADMKSDGNVHTERLVRRYPTLPKDEGSHPT